MGRILPFAARVLRAYPTAVEALDPAEGMLLLGLRLWAAEARRAEDPMPRLRQVMAMAGAPDAAASVDALMRVVAPTARRPVELGCPRCPHLAPDEQRLLHVARLAQDGETRLAEEALRAGMLSGVGAEFAIGPLEGIGEIFAQAGLGLRPRSVVEPADLAGGGVTPWMPLPATLH